MALSVFLGFWAFWGRGGSILRRRLGGEMGMGDGNGLVCIVCTSLGRRRSPAVFFSVSELDDW